MKLLIMALNLCLSVVAMASVITPARMEYLARALTKRVEDNCKVNICFAIDGSGSINPEAFAGEKNFTTRVSGNIKQLVGEEENKLAAVQYATTVRTVQRLTKDDNRFVSKVNKLKQLFGATNIDAAMLGCRFQLRRVLDEANHIVILTDGDATIGASGVKQAKQFRNEANLMSIVAAGNPNEQKLQELAGTDGVVYRVDRFEDDLELLDISEKLAERVCKERSLRFETEDVPCDGKTAHKMTSPSSSTL